MGVVSIVRAAQVVNIPPVGATAATEGAGADTAQLIYSGASAAARNKPSATSDAPTDDGAPGSVGEPSSAGHSPAAAATVGAAACRGAAHDGECQFLHRWSCSDLQDEALAAMGEHVDLEAAERAMRQLQPSRGLPLTLPQEVARTIAICGAIITHRKNMRKAQVSCCRLTVPLGAGGGLAPEFALAPPCVRSLARSVPLLPVARVAGARPAATLRPSPPPHAPPSPRPRRGLWRSRAWW